MKTWEMWKERADKHRARASKLEAANNLLSKRILEVTSENEDLREHCERLEFLMGEIESAFEGLEKYT
jgi:hypothetical protein